MILSEVYKPYITVNNSTHISEKLGFELQVIYTMMIKSRIICDRIVIRLFKFKDNYVYRNKHTCTVHTRRRDLMVWSV